MCEYTLHGVSFSAIGGTPEFTMAGGTIEGSSGYGVRVADGLLFTLRDYPVVYPGSLRASFFCLRFRASGTLQ